MMNLPSLLASRADIEMAFSDMDKLAAALGLVVITLWMLHRRTRQSLPTPPGPKGLPILGNIKEMPQDEGWLTYADWGRRYGLPSFLTWKERFLIVLQGATWST